MQSAPEMRTALAAATHGYALRAFIDAADNRRRRERSNTRCNCPARTADQPKSANDQPSLGNTEATCSVKEVSRARIESLKQRSASNRWIQKRVPARICGQEMKVIHKLLAWCPWWRPECTLSPAANTCSRCQVWPGEARPAVCRLDLV